MSLVIIYRSALLQVHFHLEKRLVFSLQDHKAPSMHRSVFHDTLTTAYRGYLIMRVVLLSILCHLQSVVKEKEAHIEQLLQEFEMERAELAKITTEREIVSPFGIPLSAKISSLCHTNAVHCGRFSPGMH